MSVFGEEFGLCARIDKLKAATAAAQKLTRLIYTVLTKDDKYTGQGQEYYEERCRERVLWNLKRRTEKRGMRSNADEAAI